MLPALKTLLRPILLLLVASLLPASARAQGLIFDPVGDARGSTDLVAVAVGYDATTLYVVMRFVTGTLDPEHLAFVVPLDTNLDTILDWVLAFDSTRNATQAGLLPFGSSVPSLLLPVTFEEADGELLVEIPLGPTGINDDGEAYFAVIVGDVSQLDPNWESDFVPDAAEQDELGGPSTPVPEPGAGLGALVALVAVWACRVRRR